MQPNIVLILVDQMRRDCLGVMGHKTVETPNLDMMAKHGYLFTKAYSAVPSCIAARAAIMTGLTQKSHGRHGYQDGVPWNYKHTLAGEFSKNGYHTQCIGKMHVFPERNLCGYHNILLHDGYLHHSRNTTRNAGDVYIGTDDYLKWLQKELGPGHDLMDAGLECNSWVARPWPYDEYVHPTNWVVHESIDFLRRRDPSKPFFLTSSFVRPHSPLDPPKYYYDMYINEPYEHPPVGDWAETDDAAGNGLDANCTRGLISVKALRRARAAYYGHITHIDHQIGRLLQAINENGVTNNTLFLFASDHGDLLGDHNLFRKALPYEGSAGIPFLIYDPGKLLGNNQNRRFDMPVELMDIMPTLLSAALLPVPNVVEGKSVVPLIQEQKANWRPYIHGEHAYGDFSNHYITDGKTKYIWFSKSGREQFFDLTADPLELHDVIGETAYVEGINRFRQYLKQEQLTGLG